MQAMFIGEDGKLRSGWRAFAFLLAFFFLAFFLILASTAVISQFDLGDRAVSLLPLILPFFMSSVVAIGLGVAFAKVFEALNASSLGLVPGVKGFSSLALGGAVGSVAIGSAVLMAAMGGGLSLALNREASGAAIAETLWTTFLVLIVGALSEETLFRGYLLQTFARSNAVWIGTVVTSLLFALAHNNNPSSNWLSFANTLLAGFWFAAAYLKTRDLWFPLGMHFMWNWLQGPVFGINVSGLSSLAPDPVFRATDAGPVVLTGGSYGIEGGAACTIAILISLGVIYFLPVKPAVS